MNKIVCIYNKFSEVENLPRMYSLHKDKEYELTKYKVYVVIGDFINNYLIEDDLGTSVAVPKIFFKELSEYRSDKIKIFIDE